MNQDVNDIYAMFLTEISAALAGNIESAFADTKALHGDFNVEPTTLFKLYSETLEQNIELLKSYADRFVADGNAVLQAWCEGMIADASRQLDLLDKEKDPAIALDDFVSGVISALDEEGKRVVLGGGSEKFFNLASKWLDRKDFSENVLKGDLTAAMAVYAGSWVNAVVTGVLTGVAVAAGAASWPVLAGIAVIGAVAGVLGGSAADDIAEDFFDFAKEPEDRREDAYQAIVFQIKNGGGSYLPGLKDYLAFGTQQDDQLSAQYDKSYSSTLIGGSGNDTLYGGDLIDKLSGGHGDDFLVGYAGPDTLNGGMGDDHLHGGRGSDLLQGGKGFDTYEFRVGDLDEITEDTIIDTDGIGKITFEGVAIGDLSVNTVSRDGLGWETHDRVFRLQSVPSGDKSTLIITHRESGGRIVVKNWSNGGLNITLPGLGQPGSPENPVSQTNDDDLVGRDGDPDEVRSGNDIISGLGGNDGIAGGYGDDWIDGGHGNDLILGGPGVNRLFGGLGDDILIGSSMLLAWRKPEDELGSGDRNAWYSESASRPGIISVGNGWLSEVSGNNPAGSDATQNLFNFSVRAHYTNGHDPWVKTNPNVLPSGNDDIDGGDGSDIAYGGEGNDTLLGGAQNDLLLGGSDHDYIEGEEGDDLIFGDDFSAANGIWSFMATQISDRANTSGNDIIFGGNGEDRIFGQGGNDVISGGEGGDILQGDRVDYGLTYSYVSAGLPGNDYIDGGAGNDRIYGDGGNDTLLGGDGADYILGDAVGIDESRHGNDVIDGGSGVDTIIGLGGDDVIRGGEGNDLLLGDASASDLALQFHGNDRIYGEGGNDEIQGNAGDDYLSGGSGKDLLQGESGNDTLSGDADDDELQGGMGNDTLIGGAGNDSLFGEDGDDNLIGDEGQDFIYGGTGNDRLSGGGGADTLVGGDGGDNIDGNQGDDVIDGELGNDSIRGGLGNDFIDGDEGDDDVDAGDGNDSVYGGGGNDLVNGGLGNDTVTAAEGNDQVNGGDGNDYLEGSDGDDTLSGDKGDDVVIGGTGNDQAVGGEGSDILYGDDQFGVYSGNDKIDGDAGDDYLDGGRGDDQLDGGTGNDTLMGAEGNDIYLIKAGDGHDEVLGFGSQSAGRDTIVLSGLSRNQATFRRSGSALVMTFGTDQSVRLDGFLARDSGGHRIVFGDGSAMDRAEALSLLGGGTAGDDDLQGSDQDDELYGQGGNDKLYGQEGNDSLNGGIGNDLVFGGGGNDLLEGGDGDDLLDGGTGDDRLYGGAGSDFFRYGIGYGNDSIAFDPAADIRQVQLLDIVNPADMYYALKNGALVMTIIETGQSITIEGYAGVNGPTARIVLADGAELLPELLWSGANEIEGSSGDDQLYGYDGEDYIYGFGGDDRIWGGNDKDYLVGGWGKDTIYGGSGNDTLQGDSHYPYWWMNGGEDDYLDGGEGDDHIYGNDGNDTLLGGAGNDSISGQDGADVLNGGAGNDALYGNAGSDLYEFGRGGGRDIIWEFGWMGESGPQFGDIDTLRFDASVLKEEIVVYRDDRFSSTLQFVIEGTDDSIAVLDFFDYLTYNTRDSIEQVVFTDGTTWDLEEILYQAMRGSHRNDNLMGLYAKDDFINAGAGNDRVMALEHDDTIQGGTGNDSIEAGEGDDVLVGGSGSDILSGDAGNDIYRFGLGSDLDVITNGSTVLTDHDVIELGEGITTENIRLARSGDALVIDIDGHADRLIVLGHFITDEHWSRGGPIDALHFADGTIWVQEDILAKLVAPLEAIAVNIDGMPYADLQDAGGYVIGIQNTLAEVHRETAGATWFDIGPGEARLFGGASGDTYVFGKGYGNQAIHDAGGTDRVLFNADLSPSDVTLYKLGNDMEVHVEGQSPLTIVGFFSEGGMAAIESMVFANGTVWDSAWLHTNAVNPDVTLNGTAGSDILRGSVGNDQLFGLEGNDQLEGDSGDDLLDGGTGTDVMRGGKGSDTYVVDDASDSIFDNGYASDSWTREINTVRSSIDYTLGVNLQRLILDGTADLNGTGNGESNTLQGNAGANVLTAAAVDDYSSLADWINGGAGNDILIGAWGNDTLIGGAGNDRMEGGGGDDLYYVDSLGDVIVEAEDEAPSFPMAMAMQLSSDATNSSVGESGAPGIPAMGEHPYRNGDTVATSIDFTLTEKLESLILVGTAVNGTGNEFSNWLSGNAQDNVLSGLGEYDTIYGGAGRDVLYGGDSGDELDGEDGNDTLVGGDGDDFYIYTAGQGHDTIVNVDVYGEDMLRVSGAAFDQFRFDRIGDDMVATLSDQSGSLTFKDWYTESANRVDRLYDQNWMELTSDQVDNLVGGAELSQLIGAMAQGEAGQEVYAQSWSERGNQPHLMIAAV
ncbi:calcium-binding protein [Xanthomonas nasturtii]|uniref:Hemolysin n=1 Tax=Xanthomonas nasturtii TaxID=1843581 RepID=A0ABT0LPM7_9XANT|nr:calcium-binding protein [Xanthomonas nasturtii]MCL1551007.1 hemolysin [Xanthomonas nasturtii]MCL1555255.1 hemolysin [Xanthomonas nasturtii]